MNNTTIPLYVEFYQSITCIHQLEEAWGRIERDEMASPYQQFAWCMNWYEEVSQHLKEHPLVITVKNNQNNIIAIFPLAMRKTKFGKIAYFIGSSHSNYNMGLLSMEGINTLTAEKITDVLRFTAAENKIDTFIFANQPEKWNNKHNPLRALGSQQSPSSAYSALLPASGNLFYEQQHQTRQSRKRFRYKERQLHTLGGYSFEKAVTLDEKLAILDTFFQHKIEWFEARGLTNPFLQPEIQAFFKGAIKADTSTVELYAFKKPDHTIATFGTMVHGGHMSGLFTSVDNTGEARRHSPGEMLLFYLMQSASERGLKSFDLGVGEAYYKESYCPIEDKLFDTAVPFTFKGHLIAFAWTMKQKLKSIVKRNPTIFKFAQRCMSTFKRST